MKSNNHSETIANSSFSDEVEELVDAKELFYSIIRNWYWILFSVIIGFLLARLYLRYTIPIYRASGKILIKDEEGNGGTAALSEEAVLQEIGLLAPGNNINNEIQLLKSRTLMEQVIRELGIDIQYIGVGRIKDTELYGGTSPILLDSVHWGEDKKRATLNVEVFDDQSYILYGNETAEDFQRSFGDPLILKKDTFWLSRHHSVTVDSPIRIKIGVGAGKYLNNLEVREGANFSSVLKIEFEDPIPEKASDIINKLISVYNQAAIDDKNQVAEKTLAFIDERLLLLTEELSTVEGRLENYKEGNQIPSEAGTAVNYILTEISQYDNEVTRQQIRLELLVEVQEMLAGTNEQQFELIPASIVFEDAEGLRDEVGNYNSLLIERDRIKRSATDENPQMVLIESQLNDVRKNIVESVRVLRQNLQLSIQEIQRKLDSLQQRINKVPQQERELLEIKRQQNIKEALYLYLLQKKEETALTAAITVPNARIIDPALTGGAPISPKSIQVYAIFLMLGFTLPIGIVFMQELLDNKIYSEANIQRLTATPVLGTVTQNDSENHIVVDTHSRTAIAEMFRLLRSNLNYFAEGENKQTLLLTSGLGGDGKTFIAINLGITLALANKRVIILGTDLRKPKLARYLTGRIDSEEVGLTNYLISNLKEEDIVKESNVHEGLYYIPSGPIPPNPAELLDSSKMAQLFEYLKQRFDYILIDTAPIGLVADAFLLERHIDITLYVVRYGKTRKESLSGLEVMRKEGKLKKLAIVLNGVKKGKGFGYGYGYGYGYYSDDKKEKNRIWFKR